jgi:SIR2-like domain
MSSVFETWKPEPGGMKNALYAIHAQRIPIATLNYDALVELCTGSGAIDFTNTEALMGWARKERQGVFHLHGVWTNPNSCIFGIRDHHAISSDETRHLIQRSLSSLNLLLFIGCGDTFADPNFSALIAWLRKSLGANVPQHYALVRNDEVKKGSLILAGKVLSSRLASAKIILIFPASY